MIIKNHILKYLYEKCPTMSLFLSPPSPQLPADWSIQFHTWTELSEATDSNVRGCSGCQMWAVTTTGGQPSDATAWPRCSNSGRASCCSAPHAEVSKIWTTPPKPARRRTVIKPEQIFSMWNKMCVDTQIVSCHRAFRLKVVLRWFCCWIYQGLSGFNLRGLSTARNLPGGSWWKYSFCVFPLFPSGIMTCWCVSACSNWTTCGHCTIYKGTTCLPF